MVTHGSLFSGIGGFDLAARWMGWENLFHCEWQEFPRRVLKYHFPESIAYEDIRKTDFSEWHSKVSVLSGGFPCQPYSTAGKRLGKEDERHLWGEMFRAIQEIEPRWVVAENVYGLVNWNDGLVLEEVCADLESAEYELIPPVILPAAAQNAPHRRERIFIIAYSCRNGFQHGGSGKDRRAQTKAERERDQWKRIRDDFRGNGEQAHFAYTTNAGPQGMRKWEDKIHGHRVAPDTKQEGLEGQDRSRMVKTGQLGKYSFANSERSRPSGEKYWEAEPKQHSQNDPAEWWSNFPTQPPVLVRNDGFPDKLDGITFPKWRNESIKAYGNAVVPQVVLQIFRAIEEFELKSKEDEE